MNYLFCRSYFQPFFICCCVGYVACVMFINLNPPLLSAASLWFFPLLYLSAKYLINESTPTTTQEEEEENTELIIFHIIISNRKRKSRRKRVQFTHTHILIIFYKIAKTTTTISIASVTLIEKNCSIFHFNWGWKFIK